MEQKVRTCPIQYARWNCQCRGNKDRCAREQVLVGMWYSQVFLTILSKSSFTYENFRYVWRVRTDKIFWNCLCFKKPLSTRSALTALFQPMASSCESCRNIVTSFQKICLWYSCSAWDNWYRVLLSTLCLSPPVRICTLLKAPFLIPNRCGNTLCCSHSP